MAEDSLSLENSDGNTKENFNSIVSVRYEVHLNPPSEKNPKYPA